MTLTARTRDHTYQPSSVVLAFCRCRHKITREAVWTDCVRVGFMKRRYVINMVLVLLLTAAPAFPAETGASPSAGQIRLWIDQLNAERFVDREVATEKLIAAGAAAVGPVLAAVADNNLEVTTRAVYVLQELALSPDLNASDAAHAALEKIAEPRLTSAARRARSTLARLDQIRQDRAIQELKHLGANVGERQSNLGFGLVEGYIVEVSEGWQGQPHDLARLRWLRDAGEVILQGPQVTDEWLKYVAPMNELPVLTVKRANVTDEGLKHLLGMKQLSLLSLMYVPLTDQAIDSLQQLQGVDKLRIYGTRLTVAGVDRLRQALATSDIDVRRGAFLGVGCQDGAEGCIVYTVRPNSAAEKAGLMMNDVILEYEGQKVADYKALIARDRVQRRRRHRHRQNRPRRPTPQQTRDPGGMGVGRTVHGPHKPETQAKETYQRSFACASGCT